MWPGFEPTTSRTLARTNWANRSALGLVGWVCHLDTFRLVTNSNSLPQNQSSSKLWSSQLWTQFKQLRIQAWKSQDFNGVWSRDLAIPVRRSNQLSYEATDFGNWSFVSSNEPVSNECEVIYMKYFIYWTADSQNFSKPKLLHLD